MPTLDDDERFESYLRQFRPLVPEALPIPRRPRSVTWIWAAAFAAVVILGVLGLRMVSHRTGRQGTTPASVEVVQPTRPLTMRNANALLASAPSYKAAVDSMAFHPQDSTIPKDKQSALAVLAKEKIKL